MCLTEQVAMSTSRLPGTISRYQEREDDALMGGSWRGAGEWEPLNRYRKGTGRGSAYKSLAVVKGPALPMFIEGTSL